MSAPTAHSSRVPPRKPKPRCKPIPWRAVADRGYFSGEEIVGCDHAGITVILPKPMTSGAKSEGRFGKQDFAYLPEEDVYRCPAGERLKYYYTNVENGLKLRRYWTNACRTCALKSRCTTAVQRRITRWEHEHVLEAVQRRLDEDPKAMRRRRETVEHPFGTIKARMGATHFLVKTLPRVAAEMALHVLASPSVLLRLTAGSCASVRQRPRPIASIWPSPAASKGSAGPGPRADHPTRSTSPVGFTLWQGSPCAAVRS
jgi:hypothetical protein